MNKYIKGKVKLGLNNGRYLGVEEAILKLAEAQYLSGDSASALTTLDKLREVRYSEFKGGEIGTAIFGWFTLKRLQGVAGIPSQYNEGVKRSGNGYLADGSGIPSSVQALKAGAREWQLPIPQTVLNKNTNMTQTPGY